MSMLKYIRLIRQKPSVASRGLRALILARYFNRRMLKGAELAVTYRCQGSCRRCSCMHLLQEHRKEMSGGDIYLLSKQITDAGGILINLTGGEPLLRQDLLSIVSRISRLPALISLTTNGLLLTDSLLGDFKKSGLNILQISLSSPLEQEHDSQIGIEGSYKKVLSAIKGARRLGIEVLINTVITRDILYSDRMDKMVSLAAGNDCFLSLVFPARVGGWQDEDVNLKSQDYKNIQKWLKLKFVTSDTESCFVKGRCPAGNEKIYISAYGDVLHCPFIHNKYGNVLEEGLLEVWNGLELATREGCMNIAP